MRRTTEVAAAAGGVPPVVPMTMLYPRLRGDCQTEIRERPPERVAGHVAQSFGLFRRGRLTRNDPRVSFLQAPGAFLLSPAPEVSLEPEGPNDLAHTFASEAVEV